MGEFKRRTLRSSSGQKVKKRKQAVAIALSEAGLSRRNRMSRRQRKMRDRSTYGSPPLETPELRTGYRVLSRPALRTAQTPAAYPGVPTRSRYG
jgi:hypothetical protein